MRLLLDTHALLWWWAGDTRLPQRVRDTIEDRASEVLVSAASAWEIATKVRIGRLPGAKVLVDQFEGRLAEHGFLPLAITVAHGRRAGSMPGRHRDPFDRILAAQSLIDDLPVASGDEDIRRFGVRTFW